MTMSRLAGLIFAAAPLLGCDDKPKPYDQRSYDVGFRDGWAGFVIALGNFEGTFYRYAKAQESMKGWDVPANQPVSREPP